MDHIDYSSITTLSEMMAENTPDGWLYIGDSHVRYILGEPKRDNILVFGINPSTATPLSLDRTLKKVKAICSNQIGNYGWIMANIYLLRETKPEMLPGSCDKTLSGNNLHILRCLLETYHIEQVWAAWGDIIESRDYLPEELLKISKVFEEKREYDEILWYHTGALTRRGNPRHPLYQPKYSEFEPFYLLEYLCEFEGLMDDYGLL